jgi:ribosomal protein S12 methylthiotransferase
MEFIKQGYVDWLGVFPYYQEPGTQAAELEQLPAGLIEERYQKAVALQQQLVQQKNKSRFGHEYKVLVHARNEDFTGHPEFAAPDIDSQVVVKGNDIEMARFYKVRINGAKGFDLCGEIESDYPR